MSRPLVKWTLHNSFITVFRRSVNFSFITCKQLSLRTILKDSFTSDRELVKMFSHADVGLKIQPYHNALWHDVTLTEMTVFNVKL